MKGGNSKSHIPLSPFDLCWASHYMFSQPKILTKGINSLKSSRGSMISHASAEDSAKILEAHSHQWGSLTSCSWEIESADGIGRGEDNGEVCSQSGHSKMEHDLSLFSPSHTNTSKWESGSKQLVALKNNNNCKTVLIQLVLFAFLGAENKKENLAPSLLNSSSFSTLISN